MIVDYGNRTPRPNADPERIGGNGPFPPGEWPIRELTGPQGNRASYGSGKIKIGDEGDTPRERSTWIHGGRGGYDHGTLGCIRVDDDTLESLQNLLRRNQDGENRVTK